MEEQEQRVEETQKRRRKGREENERSNILAKVDEKKMEEKVWRPQ